MWDLECFYLEYRFIDFRSKFLLYDPDLKIWDPDLLFKIQILRCRSWKVLFRKQIYRLKIQIYTLLSRFLDLGSRLVLDKDMVLVN